MTTILIAMNETVESGSFCGDQLCSLKAAYLFVENQPDVDKVIMSCSPKNQLQFLWSKFIARYDVEVVWDDWNPGDWETRFVAWNRWRVDRNINGIQFDHYRELYLRIHGAQRQTSICGHERGLGRRNIYEYWLAGQENKPDVFPGADYFDDTLIHHPPHQPERDVYISPHAKTQGNVTFTFDFWADVVRRLLDAGISVTAGYNSWFCEDLGGHPLYRKHWGTYEQWMAEVCRHKLVACGNTGTGWLAAACGVPMITMEPPNSQMPDHRYRECGLRNIVEVVEVPDAAYVAQRIIETCYSDDRSRKLRMKVTEVCQAAVLHSVNPFAKLKLLADELLTVMDLPGHVCDLGSYKGGSALVMRRLALDKVLNLFDTWEGNPYDDPLCHHKRGEWVASEDECRQLLSNGENNLRMTWYWKGVFPASAEALEKYQFCFVYVDMDTYQATRDAIEFFWPRMVTGGKMLFDDWQWPPCAGVEKAVREMGFASSCYKAKVVGYTYIVEKR